MKLEITSKQALLAVGILTVFGITVQIVAFPQWFAHGLTWYAAATRFLCFFTHVVAFCAIGTCLVPAIAPQSRWGLFFSSASVRTSVAVDFLFLTIAYHLLLANTWHPVGIALLASNILHLYSPVLYLLCWLAFSDLRELRFDRAIRWLSVPFAYLVVVVVRGMAIHEYPYFFLDVGHLGATQVLINGSALLIAFLVLGFILVAVARLIARFERPSAQTASNP